MRVLLGTARVVRRWIAPRAVGVAVVAVLALAVASWVVGDLARNYAIGRLHAENDLIALQGDQTETHRLAAEATAERRITPSHRAELVASQRQTEVDLNRLVQHANRPSLVRSIQQADTRFHQALALELAAIQRGQIPLALHIDQTQTDPTANALNDLLTAARVHFHQDSQSAERVAGILGWMKAIIAAAAVLLLVQQAARARARRERAEAERESLAELNRRLQEVDQLKDDFIATVSHELRTPLTSIRGYLELVQADEGLSEQGRGFVSIIDRNSQRLVRLITDLLFVAQTDAEPLDLEVSLFHPHELVEEAVASAQPFAAAQQITLSAVVDDVPHVVGDRERLAQLLDNLISNALKFTPPGGRVEVRLSRTAAGSTVLEVADTGIGIPQAEQAKTFERFYRATAATTHAIAGTGLGLAIVKLTAEAHGGTVSLQSVEGEGTAFRVVLPLPTELVPAAA
jgi:signal transduction histidine kinase